MLISIIISIYNTAPYLKRLCDSLKAQNLDDVELVFIDDCSTDNSAIELDNCLRELNHSHVQLLKNATNLGSGETRNKGIRAANGDYVIFIDSDDYISENHIAKLRPLAEEKKYDIIIFDIVELRQQKKIYKDCTPSKNRDENIANLIIGKMHNSLCNKLIRRHLYIDNNIFMPAGISLFEDKTVCFKLFEKAESIYHINQGLYFYDRNRVKSLTNINNEGSIISSILLLDVVNGYYNGRECPEIITNAIVNNRIVNTGYIALNGQWLARDEYLPKIGKISFSSFFNGSNIPLHYKVAAFCYYYNLKFILLLVKKFYLKLKK